MHSPDWHAAYARLISRTGEFAAHARWTLCGLGACVDAVVSAHEAVFVLLAASDPSARRLGETLAARAAAGIGGEIRVDWDLGPAWLDAALAPVPALGGTGPHAARVLTVLGAPALLALGHRDAEQMAGLDGGICLAQDDAPVPARDIVPAGSPRPKIYIFEFTAGRPIGDGVAPRSSRVIVRFTDQGLENDPAFEALSARLGADAGAGVLSGFSAVTANDLERALRTGRSLATRWREAGVPVVHLEMAGFETPERRDSVLDGLRGSVTSLGLSQSEYREILPGETDETETIVAMAERFGVDRLCIHADHWALAVTRGDPAQERTALMMGCLLASARADAGAPVRPVSLPPGATFHEPPPEQRRGGWSVVACPSPYLRHPRTTLGLGDTFMAGCLLVLGQPHRPEAGESPPPGAD